MAFRIRLTKNRYSMKKHLLIMWLITGLITCYESKGQQIESFDKWHEYVEELADETDDTDLIESLYADLSYLSQHPFDLNVVTAESLKRLPFLADAQIDSLLAYRDRYGPMVSIYELKNIDALDWHTIQLLLPFVVVQPVMPKRIPWTLANLAKYGKNEALLRYDRTLQTKQGYQPQPDSVLEQYPNRQYLGEPFYHSIRYTYAFDNRLQAGLVAEKDAGEPFWNRHHKGYDYYSAHLLLRDLGRMQTLAIGDYKASFGQGLVMSHDFTPGRSALVTQAERRTNGFRRHQSANEVAFLRGAATTVRWQNTTFSLFYSYRTLDATTDGARIESFKTDGLHRTVGDLEKRHTAPLQTWGTNIRYTTAHLVLGITGVGYTFGRQRVDPDPHPYNVFYFRGSHNQNVSVDYRYRKKQLKLYGETAWSKNGGTALLHALQWSPASYFTGLALFRSYAKNYHALYGQAFGQNGTVQNEQGFYVGLQGSPLAHWKLSFYGDWFRFPWLKYGVDAPSAGAEYMAQIDHFKGERLGVYLRYRYRQKMANRLLALQPETPLYPSAQHRFRLQASYRLWANWTFRSAADCLLYNETQGNTSNGWMVSQSVTWRKETSPLQADAYLAWFETDDYDNRLLSHEKNLLYVYYSPFLYHHGTRFAAVLRYFLQKKLSLSAKFAWTHFFNRETSGSGLETIEGRNRTDASLLLQWKF